MDECQPLPAGRPHAHLNTFSTVLRCRKLPSTCAAQRESMASAADTVAVVAAAFSSPSCSVAGWNSEQRFEAIHD